MPSELIQLASTPLEIHPLVQSLLSRRNATNARRLYNFRQDSRSGATSAKRWSSTTHASAFNWNFKNNAATNFRSRRSLCQTLLREERPSVFRTPIISSMPRRATLWRGINAKVEVGEAEMRRELNVIKLSKTIPALRRQRGNGKRNQRRGRRRIGRVKA